MPIVTVPARLWINGVEHAIQFRTGLIAGHDAQGGSCDNLAQIDMDPSLKPSQRVEVFLHECLHRIEYALGWGCGGNKGNVLTENQTIALGKALAGLCHELGVEFDFTLLPTLD
jgi:hypothetical protein